MTVLDLLDDILGPLSLGDRLFGAVYLASTGFRRGTRRHRVGFDASTHIFGLVRPAVMAKRDLVNLLRRYGVQTFGWHHDSKNFYFSVKKRQARWAEYILLNAGVELANRTFDQRNPGYVGRHGAGWMPTPWSETERDPSPEKTPAAMPTSTLSRLSQWLDDLLEA